MKVGDLVRRKSMWKYVEYSPQNDDGGIGLVMSLQLGGRDPVHPCATIFYPKISRRYNIAVSLLEVINEGR